MFHVKHSNKDNIIQVRIGARTHTCMCTHAHAGGQAVDRTSQRTGSLRTCHGQKGKCRRTSAQGEIFTGGEQSDVQAIRWTSNRMGMTTYKLAAI